jgi:hypothetical protein
MPMRRGFLSTSTSHEEIGYEKEVTCAGSAGFYDVKKRLSLLEGQDCDVSKVHGVIRFFRELQIHSDVGRNRPADAMFYLPLEGFTLVKDAFHIFVSNVTLISRQLLSTCLRPQAD